VLVTLNVGICKQWQLFLSGYFGKFCQICSLICDSIWGRHCVITVCVITNLCNYNSTLRGKDDGQIFFRLITLRVFECQIMVIGSGSFFSAVAPLLLNVYRISWPLDIDWLGLLLVALLHTVRAPETSLGDSYDMRLLLRVINICGDGGGCFPWLWTWTTLF